ncbi:MAG TPA: glycosyltransferase family protein [Anaeromyxobacteraceae bacterium]|nr:glycosyltransferase family protein [Anaeromyxobacteraceae bacterium]
MKTLVVVQARTGSSRLPAKVLLPLAGAPLLERQLERIRAARPRSGFEVVVATSTLPGDAPIVALCQRLGVACFRGHPTDLLDRHYRAASQAGAEAVVKIPSDCPLLDPVAVEKVLDAFEERRGELDYLSNLHPPSWPDGHDVEVMSLSALAVAHREATAPHEREHTTPFLWERPERFRIGNVTRPGGEDLSSTYRLTIDYPEDYALIAAVYRALWSERRPVFPLSDVLAYLDAHPAVAARNAAYLGVTWYTRHLAEQSGTPGPLKGLEKGMA